MLVVVEAGAVATTTTTRTCSVCGAYGPPSTPFPDKRLPEISGPLSRCLDLEESSLYVGADTQLCRALQALGPYCGCNTPPDACSLCWDGSLVTKKKNLTLPNYQASDFINTYGYDLNMTCETLEAFLPTLRSSNAEQQCLSIQLDVGEQCGCPPVPIDLQPDTDNATVMIPSTPSNQSVTAEEEEPLSTNTTRRSCTLCENGDPPPFPDKLVEIGQEQTWTCSRWDAFAAEFEDGSADCDLIRPGASRICGCPRPEGSCTMCPLGEDLPYPQKQLNWLTDSFLSSIRDSPVSDKASFLTCQMMEAHVAGGNPYLSEVFGVEEELFCTAIQMKSWTCGCRPDWRPILLTWCYRISGMLSLIGSGLIIISILRKTNRRFTTYHQLVLGISIFDIISSTAYMLVGVMAPYEAGFYPSRGNRTTCKIQGFMIQLGQTASMFYNLCLSLYFFTVIILSWREDFLRKILVGVHICVIAIGLGLSIAAIPYIEAQFGVCGILPPLTASQWQVSLFYTVPVSIVLVVLTSATISICYQVYSRQARVRKWRADKRGSVTKKVFWQSAWYVSAFYVTLPFVLLSFYVKFKSSRYFWIYIATAALAPLQGMMNALIYFQRSNQFQSWWNRILFCRKASTTTTAQPQTRPLLSTAFSNMLLRRIKPGTVPAAEDVVVVDDDDDEVVEDVVDGSFMEAVEQEPEDVESALEVAAPEWNSAYLEEDDDDDDDDDTCMRDSSNESAAHVHHQDPLAPPDVNGDGSPRPRRRDVDLARLQTMTHPVSSLQTFRRWSMLSGRTKERVQNEMTGGVLEYWKLHEEEPRPTLVAATNRQGKARGCDLGATRKGRKSFLACRNGGVLLREASMEETP